MGVSVSPTFHFTFPRLFINSFIPSKTGSGIIPTAEVLHGRDSGGNSEDLSHAVVLHMEGYDFLVREQNTPIIFTEYRSEDEFRKNVRLLGAVRNGENHRGPFIAEWSPENEAFLTASNPQAGQPQLYLYSGPEQAEVYSPDVKTDKVEYLALKALGRRKAREKMNTIIQTAIAEGELTPPGYEHLMEQLERNR